MEDYYPPLLSNQFYHIYNRGNNKENIFFNHDNYLYFLKKYDFYLSNYIETYAFCLLSNHFHLLVRVKSEEEVIFMAKKSKLRKMEQPIMEINAIISEVFRRFFMSYAKSINVQQGRTGSLFQKNFKRKLIDSDSYFSEVIRYIHSNPIHHGLSQDFINYPYSSFKRILSDRSSKLMKREVLYWFGGKEQYLKFHQYSITDVSANFWIEEE